MKNKKKNCQKSYFLALSALVNYFHKKEIQLKDMIIRIFVNKLFLKKIDTTLMRNITNG